MRADALSAESIVARIERLPVSAWHVRMRIIVGSATFFDSFDALAIAFVAPALIGIWHITPGEIGILVSGGYVGQALGGPLFGWIAERYGRLASMLWSIAWFSLASLGCAFAPDYGWLLALRFIQGFGTGGEVPVAMAYMNEFAKAERRGFFVLIYQSIYPVGIIAGSLLGYLLVPGLGWQSMFVLGAAPALLVLFLRRLLPESPRWLASRGRLDEADGVLSSIEAAVSEGGRRPLPPPPANLPRVASVAASWRDLLGGRYARRTITAWIMCFISSFVGFGVTIWLPTIYRTVFKLPVDQALLFSTLNNVALLLGVLTCTNLVDRLGRRAALTIGFAGSCAVPLVVWSFGPGISVMEMVVLGTIASYFVAQMQIGMSFYPTELYPTRIRALASGTAGFFRTAGSIVGPLLAGFVLQSAGLGADFLMLAGTAFIGAAIMLFLAVETRGRLLEELSP